MRTHRIHTAAPLEPGESTSLTNGPAHYLARVLRATNGQTVVLFNGDGHDYAAEIVEIKPKTVHLRINTRLPGVAESPLEITVVQAISRGERFDATLQKCTELGAAAFQPLITARTEVRIRAGKLERKMQHWHSVIVSACEQSGRAVIPGLAAPLALQEWQALPKAGSCYVLDPESRFALASVSIDSPIALVIGPEGGFSDEERAQLANSGVDPVSLGPRVLRTETAGPAAMAVLQAIAGDFL